jgi:topoisomerase-4 subunit A
LVEIKGWKSVGNRLSEYKVTKVTLVEEEEPPAEEEPVIEATESDDDSQSSKKKVEATQPDQPEPKTTIEDDGQISFFGETAKPKVPGQQGTAQQKAKIKAEQQSLFGNQGQQKEKPAQNPEKKESKEEVKPKEKDKGEDKSFGVGTTIEFDL